MLEVVLSDVMGEAAKTVTASAASAGLAGVERLWRLIRRKSDRLPSDVTAVRELLVEYARDDPEWAAEIARELAARLSSAAPDDGLSQVSPPPIPFWDRDLLRKAVPDDGVVLFCGPPGSGKTALVRQLAADRAARFPVDRCQVDLDSFRDGDVPLLSEAKRHVLRQWGITEIVEREPDLSQQYLKAGFHRPVLLVVENVLSADEVAALAPGWPAALVLVTTRRLTADLRSRYRWFEIGGLDAPEAEQMLAQHCHSPALLAAEQDATDTMVARFGRLPQALQLLGGMLAFHAGEEWPVAALLDRFEVEGITDTDALIGRSLADSVAALSAAGRADFVLLATHPTGEFTSASAGALLGRPAQRGIDELRELGLVGVAESGRYGMAWSTRRYSDELAEPVDKDAAFDRLLAFYVDRGVAADLAGGERMRYYHVPPVQPWDARRDRIDWLDAEADVVADLVDQAFGRGRFVQVGQLCGALEVLSLHRGRHTLCLPAFQVGARAADELGIAPLVARQRALAGRAATMLHRFDQAGVELDAARRIAATVDDPALASSISEFLGRLAEEQEDGRPAPDWRPAIAAFTRSVEIDRRAGGGRALGLHARMLANVLVKDGRAREALRLLDEAAANTNPGDDRNASRVHAVRAKAFVVVMDLPAARAELDRAVTLATAANAEQYQEELTDLAAEIEFRDGDIAQARSRWGALAQQCVDAGHPRSARYFAKLTWTPTPRR